MKISDFLPQFQNIAAAELYRDGQFDSLGYVTHRINTKSLLVFAGNEKFLNLCMQNKLVTCVIVPEHLAVQVPDSFGVIVSANPMETFFKLHNVIVHENLIAGHQETEVAESACVHPTAIISKQGVTIGEGSKIGPGVVINAGTQIGRNCTILANSVVGSEGFELKMTDGKLSFVPHAGGVVLGDDVRIHANCSIDRGLFSEPTVIGRNSFVDNNVHIAHGVKIGENCIVTAGVTFAAAVLCRDGVRIDPNATIGHEVEIGTGAYISMGAVVARDVDSGQRVSGNFAIPHKKFLRWVLGSAKS